MVSHFSQKLQVLILIVGYPGAGKTTLSFALGSVLRIPVLSKDTIRDTAAACGYRYESLSDLAYETLNSMAADQLRLGISAIVDCSCTRTFRRVQFADLSSLYGARFVQVLVQCPDRTELKRRLSERTVSEHRVRDLAKYDEVVSMFDEFESPSLTVSSLEPLDDIVTDVLNLLIRSE